MCENRGEITEIYQFGNLLLLCTFCVDFMCYSRKLCKFGLKLLPDGQYLELEIKPNSFLDLNTLITLTRLIINNDKHISRLNR